MRTSLKRERNARLLNVPASKEGTQAPRTCFIEAMLDLLDLLLLRRGLALDDRTLAFRRIEANPRSRVIYFLPWNTPFGLAQRAGLLPLDFLAAYEMPAAIVSSEPELSVRAMMGLVADAEALLLGRGVAPSDAAIVGLSVGTFPATYLANRLGARLCAVTPADRADLMVWQSPAARLVKRRAMAKGFQFHHYSQATAGCHPIENLTGIAPDSLFVLGTRDPFVPPRRTAGLLEALRRHAPAAQVIKLRCGHFRTLLASRPHQLRFLGRAPTSWRAGFPGLPWAGQATCRA
jgi:hypothetical protein